MLIYSSIATYYCDQSVVDETYENETLFLSPSFESHSMVTII